MKKMYLIIAALSLYTHSASKNLNNAHCRPLTSQETPALKEQSKPKKCNNNFLNDRELQAVYFLWLMQYYSQN